MAKTSTKTTTTSATANHVAPAPVTKLSAADEIKRLKAEQDAQKARLKELEVQAAQEAEQEATAKQAEREQAIATLSDAILEGIGGMNQVEVCELIGGKKLSEYLTSKDEYKSAGEAITAALAKLDELGGLKARKVGSGGPNLQQRKILRWMLENPASASRQRLAEVAHDNKQHADGQPRTVLGNVIGTRKEEGRDPNSLLGRGWVAMTQREEEGKQVDCFTLTKEGKAAAKALPAEEEIAKTRGEGSGGTNAEWTSLRKPGRDVLNALLPAKKPMTRNQLAEVVEATGVKLQNHRLNAEANTFKYLTAQNYVESSEVEVDGKVKLAYTITPAGRTALQAAEATA